MSNSNQTNLTNPDFWIRLLYMILFCVLAAVARIVIVVIAVLQAILVLLAREANNNLQILGDSIGQWTQQAYRFLTFASDQKPFPFQDWPVGRVDGPEPEISPPVDTTTSQSNSGTQESDDVGAKTGQSESTEDNAEQEKDKDS